MLLYFIVQGEMVGLSYDTKIKQGKMVFVIRDKESKILPILLELLLAHIFEKLGKFESEIARTESGIIATITLA